MKTNSNYTRDIQRLIQQTGYGLDYVALGIEINASEKSIYKWMNGTSLPDCRHLLELMRLAEANKSSNKTLGR